MVSLTKSKIWGWLAMAIVIAIIIITFPARTEWWIFFDIFFAFMMVFFHLLALYLKKATAISRTLDFWAFIFGVLTVLAIIGEFIAMQYLF